MSKEIIEGFRLSPQQEHLWLLQQVDKSQVYRAQCAVLIEGNLDTNTLTEALHDLVNRHEILRTNFHCLPGMTIPVQVITNNNSPLGHKRNLSGCNFQEKESKVEAIFQEASQIPFDLEKGSLVHTFLTPLSPSSHILVLSLPALCADTFTLEKLVHELSRSYEACCQGKQLPDEPLQYADFSEWQNELLEAEDLEIGREYWRNKNFFSFDVHKLSFENNSSGNPGFKPQHITLNAKADLVDKIEAIAHKYGTCTSTFFLACWSVLLWRLTQCSDIVVGTKFNGRKYEELRESLGLFAKYLPVSCHLEKNLKFEQVLQKLNKSKQDFYKWQECFSWELMATQDTDYADLPYFPVCFNYEDKKAKKYFGGNLGFLIYKQYTCIDRFKIKLSCLHSDDALTTEFHYDSNLFGAEDVQRLAGQFHKLLESTTNNPEAAIGELEILSDRDRQQLLVELNQTQTDYPKDKCIHHLFEEQAERTPNSVAVVFEDQQLTYAELNARANQLAHYLQQLGVGPEVLVGIYVERSLEMVIGILGILKAGGAYVPLDPTYPKERLAFILQDTQTPVLLTQQQLLDSLPEHKSHVVCLDTDWETIAQNGRENLDSSSGAENIAYVIYTSGSTGKPKGVQIAHGNLVHSTNARITYYQEPVNSFLLLSSFAFDSSVAGIFWTVCRGGILCLPQEGLQREVPKIVELIARIQVSHLLSLPSLYASLLEQAKPEQLVSLHTVIVAGEPCPRELVERHLELSTETSLFNEYGPTEGTVWSSVYHCWSQEARAQVSIGCPIANTKIYLLDSHLHPVPIGVPGELCISSDGLARGYLNQPEMTAERFIPGIFSNKPGMRLYKTGDLARYLPDGNLEFLGRIDNQVKVRGFRIELEEIESALRQHQEVWEVAVLVREDEPGDKRLVAYVVPNQEKFSGTSKLRLFLRKKLPEYMVPSAFVPLKNFPLTPNGKVDRQALPSPDTARPDLEDTYVAPRTLIEESLAKIWAEVLRLERVGIRDNFFDLGGHSLLVTQVVSRLRDTFEVEIPLGDFFEAPTIADLAVTVTQRLAEETDGEMLTQTFAELKQLSEEEIQAVLGAEEQSISGRKAENE